MMTAYISIVEKILFCEKPKRKVWTYEQIFTEVAAHYPRMKNRRLIIDAIKTLKDQNRIWDASKLRAIQTFPDPPPRDPKKPKVKKPSTISSEQLAININASHARRETVKAEWWAKERVRFLAFFKRCYVHAGYWKTITAVLTRVTRGERRCIARLVADGQLMHVKTPCCDTFIVPTEQADRILSSIPELDMSIQKEHVQALLAKPEMWIKKRDALNVLINELERNKKHKSVDHVPY